MSAKYYQKPKKGFEKSPVKGFFFLSRFSFTNIHDSLDSRGRGRLFLFL